MNPNDSAPYNQAWYVVLTKPKQELRAQENLERQGGVVFLPMFANERIVRGKRVVRQEPLFPGYLFLQTDAQGELLSKVRSTMGVRQLLAFAGQVITVDDRLIEDLRQRSYSETLSQQFSAGQTVTLKSGPFQHYKAIFKEHDGSERGIILLGLLGQQNEILIELANLRAT